MEMQQGLQDAGLRWNERLEFLGDTVLSLAVSHKLMERKERFDEGELSRIRASLVNEETLAEIARDIGLGECLLLGKGEENSDGRKRDSLLADALEALLGAAFLDKGFDRASELVGQLFFSKLESDVQLLVQMDFKTMLQEVTQDKMRVTPEYEVVGETGPDHDKEFEVVVLLSGEERGRGRGASKKRASQAAAREALDIIVSKLED
jgi:ribonuclease-3